MKRFLLATIITMLAAFTAGLPLAATDAFSQTLNLTTTYQVIDGSKNDDNNNAKDLPKRTTVNLDCPLHQYPRLLFALTRCRNLALVGETASSWGTTRKFKEYWRGESPYDRWIAAARYRSILQACASEQEPLVDITCTDHDGRCSEVAAYSRPADAQVVICPGFWALPFHSKECRLMDRGMLLVEVMSQLPAVYSPSTREFARSYQSLIVLPSSQAIYNSITLPLYAQGKILFFLIAYEFFD